MQASTPAPTPDRQADQAFSPDWIRGVREFNHQMFPVFPHGTVLFAQFALNYAIVALALLPTAHAPDWKELVCGGLSSVLFNYLLRVFDEIKDYRTDAINFPDRPLVRGKLGLAGARHLWKLAVVVLVALQLPFLGRPVIPVFLVVMAYSFLTYRWFFAEHLIRPSLPLALLSHNPIIYLYAFYCLSFFGLPFHTSGLLPATIYLVGDTMGSTAWELARKIRGTEQETAYTTYSKLWGPAVPTLLVGLLLTGSWAITMTTVRAALGNPAVLLYWIPPLVGLLVFGFFAVRFIADPRRAPPFRTLVETFKIGLFVSAVLTLTLGVS